MRMIYPPEEPNGSESLGLMWFRHDLRLHDNPAFTALAATVNRLLCVYVFDPDWLRPQAWQAAHMGKHRQRFLVESLTVLDQQLREHGQQLFILVGKPQAEITKLCVDFGVTHLYHNNHPGIYERRDWQAVTKRLSQLSCREFYAHTLFTPDLLPFELADMPGVFSPFRRKVEQRRYADCVANCVINYAAKVGHLPPLPKNADSSFIAAHTSAWLSLSNTWSNAWREARERECEQGEQSDRAKQETAPQNFSGGEIAALAQLDYYLEQQRHIDTYKQTRNGLAGWDYSSKFSPWLALGCLSPRYLADRISDYERQVNQNESTYWLYFELLWREFFQWQLYRHGSHWFRFGGVQGKPPRTTFYPERFAKWCAGATPYPIVNACMKQLNATGFMSNRGRQLVASALVHELGLDWRYGAAYFEQQLLDFDVASNWGNWQYLAGVGADPRGHRRFNLAKQTQQYDPKGEFIAAWQGEDGAEQALDSVDAADWPVGR